MNGTSDTFGVEFRDLSPAKQQSLRGVIERLYS